MAQSSFKYIGLIMLVVVGLSCSQFRSVTIEYQQPAKSRVPEKIQSLTLMNRAMTNDFRNFNEDSLQRYFYRHGFKADINVLDSLAADTCLQAIGELLYESGRFDIVIPVERNIDRDLNYYITEQPLDWEYVDSICKTYQTDALLVMERFINRVKTHFEAEAYPYATDWVRYSLFYAAIDVVYDSFFRIYYPKEKEIVGQLFISDTIFWENEDVEQRRLFKELGSVKQALIATGIKVALDLNDNISPHWVPDSRGVFIINKTNETERNLINSGNWAQLTEYWQPLLKSKNRSLRSKAEFNMALINELDGRIDDAISWATKSYRSSFRNQTETYLKRLQERKTELLRMEQTKE